mmetsp:Transcript_14054/g.20578  ORF Transcript_14054/g.20578 Transcript_14054/m.20578 type:complete len:275 (+) Transcript_14054:87-911(+)
MSGSSKNDRKKLAVATRLHLGNASEPPHGEKLENTIKGFCGFCKSLADRGIADVKAYIAVDATPKFDGYSLVDTIVSMTNGGVGGFRLEVIPVRPWNKFVPALNALVSQACMHENDYILMVSAETSASAAGIERILAVVTEADALVAGAVLPGHDYATPNSSQPLSGRTTPWNTLCIWKLQMLALVGFPLVAEGLHANIAAGVEEVSTIALIQRTVGADRAKAFLVPLEDIKWDQQFDDPERKAWHERKMQSKVERPARHLGLLNNCTGVVHHL